VFTALPSQVRKTRGCAAHEPMERAAITQLHVMKLHEVHHVMNQWNVQPRPRELYTVDFRVGCAPGIAGLFTSDQINRLEGCFPNGILYKEADAMVTKFEEPGRRRYDLRLRQEPAVLVDPNRYFGLCMASEMGHAFFGLDSAPAWRDFVPG
jgi:hypothetical protein